ncbi:MAG: c-type cytochrome [Gemmatimonadaceae bacterium]
MTIRATIAVLLIACTAGARRARAQAPDGKAIYEENCRKCHGVRGTPPKTMKEKFPKIATFDEAFAAKRTDDSVVKVLNKGVGKAEDMKSFKDKLSPDEMAAVAKYVRELALKSHSTG